MLVAFATLLVGRAAGAESGLGLGGVLSAPTPAPDPVAVVSSAGDAAEGRIAGTVRDVVSHLRAERAPAEPVPSLMGPRDDPVDGVSESTYAAFEALVVAPSDAVDVTGVPAATDAFSAPGVDGGVPGVTFGRLGGAPPTRVLRVIR